MTPAFGETVTVWLEERDRFGDVTVTGERTILGCAVAPRTSVEDVGSGSRPRATVTTGMTLYVPAGSGLTAQHRVRLADGTVWRVEGSPGRWRSPFTGWYPGDQIELERVTG